ncbi:MAG: ATP synthase F1 subunit gamma [Oligoflexales bacterium]
MASQKDIKQRINSVKSTQKITKAMKLVSAAKFAKASHAVQSARPFSESLRQMVGRLQAMAASKNITSPLIEVRSEKKTLIVIVATDRGLCGGLNTNTFKKATSFVQQKASEGVEPQLYLLGRRALSFSKKLKFKAIGNREKALDKPTYETARSIAKNLIDAFLKGECDSVYVVFPRFRSALVQSPEAIMLLPIMDDTKNASSAFPIVEPALKDMLDNALSKQIETMMYQILLEGAASEHGARMTAMDSATSNAGDVIRKLTIQYNRARQAAITKELIEIISGAEAL